MKKVLITGAAGYLGSEVIKVISKDSRFEKIIGADVRDRPAYLDGLNFTYVKADVRDAGGMLRLMKEHQIDTVVHLASIVNPGKDSSRAFEYAVDVQGTQNVLDACIQTGVKKIIVTSSGAAYGYHKENAEWIDEKDPIRGNYEFAYSHHKKLVEEMLAAYRKSNPELKQLIFRPGTILGVTTKNQITNLFEKKIVMGIKGSKSPFVFIWDRDVVNCVVKGIIEDRDGIFNLAGDGALSLKEIAEILKKPYLPIPPGFLSGALGVLKKMSLTQYGPDQVNFLRYRPVLSNKRLKSEFGYIPEKTSRDTFLFYLEHKK